MSKQPSFSGIRNFLQQGSDNPNPDVTIIGIPFDLGTTNRPGARFGPSALREASMFFNGDVDDYFEINPCDILGINDIGDLDIINSYIEESLTSFEEQLDQNIKGTPVTLGGDHTCTLPVLRSLYKKHNKPISLVHFDAHLDTWDNNFGGKVGHGTPFYNAVEEGLVDARTSIQLGIRSPVDLVTKQRNKKMGFTTISAEEVHTRDLASIVQQIKQTVGDNSVYLTFDVDSIDPSQAPGTGTPEIGGLWTWQVLYIIKRLNTMNWIGMDLVEVLPMIDNAQITSLFGATVIWNFLCILAQQKLNAGDKP